MRNGGEAKRIRGERRGEEIVGVVEGGRRGDDALQVEALQGVAGVLIEEGLVQAEQTRWVQILEEYAELGNQHVKTYRIVTKESPGT